MTYNCWDELCVCLWVYPTSNSWRFKQNHRRVPIGGTSRCHVVQHPCSSKVTYRWLLRTVSRWLLQISKDEDSTTSLSNLCQCSITFTVKKRFLVFRRNVLCFISFVSLCLTSVACGRGEVCRLFEVLWKLLARRRDSSGEGSQHMNISQSAHTRRPSRMCTGGCQYSPWFLRHWEELGFYCEGEAYRSKDINL